MKKEDIAYFIVDNINLSSEELALRLIQDLNPNVTPQGRTNLIEVLRKYKDTRTGLEAVANKVQCILGLFSFDACDDPIGDCSKKHKIDLDKITFLQNKGFTDPEELVIILDVMEKAGIAVDLNLVDEGSNAMCEYCVKYQGNLYSIDNISSLTNAATDSLTDYYYSSAGQLARDEVSEMDNISLAENAGYYTVENVIEQGENLLIIEKE